MLGSQHFCNIHNTLPYLKSIHSMTDSSVLDSTASNVLPMRPGAGQPLIRNPGVPFDASWFDALRVNMSAVERRIATLGARRSVKKDAQAAWLLKAVTCIDLTTLSGDDTAGRVRRLCAKARQPVRADLLDALGIDSGTPSG